MSGRQWRGARDGAGLVDWMRDEGRDEGREGRGGEPCCGRLALVEGTRRGPIGQVRFSGPPYRRGRYKLRLRGLSCQSAVPIDAGKLCADERLLSRCCNIPA